MDDYRDALDLAWARVAELERRLDFERRHSCNVNAELELETEINSVRLFDITCDSDALILCARAELVF